MPASSRIYYHDHDINITILNARIDAFKETYPAPDYKIVTESRYVFNLGEYPTQITYFVHITIEPA